MSDLTILNKNIIQANPLIEARKHMNMTEMRLFGLGLADITPHIKDNHVHDVEFHDTWITYTDLISLFSRNNGGNVANLKKQILKAYQGFIEITKEDGGFILRHIYEEMVYVPQKGLLIRFHEKLKPYILDLVGKAYTVYKLNLLFLLSSEYSQRLIELLLEKQGYLKKHDKVFRILTIEEVREKLNVPDGKYKGRINNFRSRILDLPIKEINEKTDYYVWYEVQKTGRTVTGFKFWMKFKDGIKQTDKTDEQSPDLPALPVWENYTPNICAPIPKSDREELTNAMVAEGMTKAAINTWIKRDGLDSVKKSFSLAVSHANRRTPTKHEGEQRRAYIKHCMEINVAAINADDARLKAEIDEREKRLAEEKKANMAAMSEGFAKLGFQSERRGSDLQAVGDFIGMDERQENKIVPQELSQDTLKMLKLFYNTSGCNEHFENALKNRGYNYHTFVEKYGSDWFEKI